MIVRKKATIIMSVFVLLSGLCFVLYIYSREAKVMTVLLIANANPNSNPPERVRISVKSAALNDVGLTKHEASCLIRHMLKAVGNAFIEEVVGGMGSGQHVNTSKDSVCVVDNSKQFAKLLDHGVFLEWQLWENNRWETLKTQKMHFDEHSAFSAPAPCDADSGDE